MIMAHQISEFSTKKTYMAKYSLDFSLLNDLIHGI
jgi:hypothetical protein